LQKLDCYNKKGKPKISSAINSSKKHTTNKFIASIAIQFDLPKKYGVEYRHDTYTDTAHVQNIGRGES